jgi:DNA-binding NtrC family response regulator
MRIMGVNKEEMQMNERMTVSEADTMAAALWTRPAPAGAQPWGLEELEMRRPSWTDAQNERSMEDIMESLISAYLVANLNVKRTPLKEFMDDFERRILRTCLTLTQGHQRNAAAILGLKNTALFEKMRKHCINGRQMKLIRRLGGAQPAAEK